MKNFMINQQKKKFKSQERGIIRNISDPNLLFPSQKTPQHQLFFQFKHHKRFNRLRIPKQPHFHQNFSKHLQILKFTSSVSKNIEQKSNNLKQIKQIKIPSFFKKQQQIKEVHYDSEFSQSKIATLDESDLNQRTSLDLLFNLQNDKNQQEQSLVESCSYGKLNNKINYLMCKISSMNTLLDQKRYQKIQFMKIEKSVRASTIVGDEDVSTCSSSQAPLKKFINQAPHHKDLYTFFKNPYSPKNSIYYISQVLRGYREQKSLIRQHLQTSMRYLKTIHSAKIPPDKLIEHLKVKLPNFKGEDRKTIILDLDETLIHCNQNVYLPCDFKIKINFPTGEFIQVGINVRPFAKQILAALSKNFEIVVFTASHSCYANIVLDYLDPERKHIHHRIFRQNCYYTPEGIYVKDLRIINRPLSKMVLVDNAAYSYAYQPLNGVPIIPYYEGKNDYQLPALEKYLESLLFSIDVREKNRNTFKLDRYPQFNDLNALVQKLYNTSHH